MTRLRGDWGCYISTLQAQVQGEDGEGVKVDTGGGWWPYKVIDPTQWAPNSDPHFSSS